MSKTKTLSWIILCCVVGGCSTAERLRALDATRLSAEKMALLNIEATVEGSSLPLDSEQMEFFFSKAMLNSILLLGDNYEFETPNLEDVRFRINQLRVSFDYGLPEVFLDISATQLKYNLSVQVRTFATLMLAEYDGPSPHFQARIVLHDFVPVARWWPFELRMRNFVGDLLHLGVQNIADSLPKFDVPLKSTINLSTPSNFEFPLAFGEALVRFAVVTPGLQDKIDISITRIIALKDGLRIYVRLKASDNDR